MITIDNEVLVQFIQRFFGTIASVEENPRPQLECHESSWEPFLILHRVLCAQMLREGLELLHFLLRGRNSFKIIL